MIGLNGIFCDDPEQLGAAWDEALAARVPTILEVKTDPEVPPLLPHITLMQAQKFTSMLIKGDPNETSLIKDVARQMMATILPGD